MKEFVDFLLTKVYKPKSIPESYIEIAFEKTFQDVKYHFPEITKEGVKKRIVTNSNELALFLFRLGNVFFENNIEELKHQIHWLLKEMCSCEIYFNNEIDFGFYIIHGEGVVIGSRNKIGKGFKVHQGCTVGHKKNGGGNGSIIGDNVTMYCNSSVIGELKIGDNAIIGAHVLLTEDLKNDTIIVNKGKTEIKSLKQQN
jgi:serine O-acetyltransferase